MKGKGEGWQSVLQKRSPSLLHGRIRKALSRLRHALSLEHHRKGRRRHHKRSATVDRVLEEAVQREIKNFAQGSTADVTVKHADGYRDRQPGLAPKSKQFAQADTTASPSRLHRRLAVAPLFTPSGIYFQSVRPLNRQRRMYGCPRKPKEAELLRGFNRDAVHRAPRLGLLTTEAWAVPVIVVHPPDGQAARSMRDERCE